MIFWSNCSRYSLASSKTGHQKCLNDEGLDFRFNFVFTSTSNKIQRTCHLIYIYSMSVQLHLALLPRDRNIDSFNREYEKNLYIHCKYLLLFPWSIIVNWIFCWSEYCWLDKTSSRDGHLKNYLDRSSEKFTINYQFNHYFFNIESLWQKMEKCITFFLN